MPKNPRYSSDPDTGDTPIHTPGGMAEPAAREGRSADGADIASTDMDQNPSSSAAPAADYGAATGHSAGLPAEPEAEAIRRLENEVAAAKDQHLRLAAEFDNYRKRTARERIELSERAQAAFIMRLLDVLDDLDRLVESDSASTSAD